MAYKPEHVVDLESGAIIAGCAVAEMKTCIAQPRVRGKLRWKRKCGVAREALQKNQRPVRSGYGKWLLRQRGETVEQSVAHVLDTEGVSGAPICADSRITRSGISCR